MYEDCLLKLDYFCLRDLCERLADLSDTLIRDVQDSLILQPAYLDIATTKRKADEVRSTQLLHFAVFAQSFNSIRICRPTLASCSSTR